jgi:hypothetical protein
VTLSEAPTRPGMVDRTRTDHRQPGTGMAVRFTPIVRLTKQEAFAACQALADADRALLQAGRSAEATALGDLFELFEERLVAR